MRVILQISSGPQTGRKVLLGANRELKIGRSEWAEFACPEDVKMSRVHCKVDTNDYGCSVEDLASSNGTFVNEVHITEKTVLRSGDTVRAGSTQFQVQIEGDSPEDAVTVNQQHVAEVRAIKESTRSARESAEREAVLKGEKKLGYRKAEASSGAMMFTPSEPPGKRAAAEAARLALLLKDVASQYLLLYPLKLPEIEFHEFPDAEPVYDWLPASVQRDRSPLLLPATMVTDLPGLFEQAWGRNALVTLISSAKLPEVLKMLRKASRPAGSENLLGICWPNVLDGLLCGGDGSLFTRDLADVLAVLVEDVAHDYAWKLIAEAGFVDVLEGLGLEEARKVS